jgi:pimeloyl-ACP methyl ester carboxylesterase
MTPVYFIPGMGTTSEVFSDLDLDKEYRFLEFLEPFKDENLSQYATRMNESIQHKEEIILVGMSMGGFIAQEIAALRPVKKIILISSFSKGQDWQYFLKWIKKYNITDLMTQRAFKDIIMSTLYVLPGYSSVIRKKSIEMAKSFSKEYFEFAAKQLLGWTPISVNSEVVQIHGSHDELFPIASFQPKYTIDRGGHLMIFTHPTEISQILKTELA